MIVDAGRGAVAFDGANIWVANRGDGTVEQVLGRFAIDRSQPQTREGNPLKWARLESKIGVIPGNVPE